MDKLTNVSCDYTGGGIYVYSALYNNDVWLTTDFYGSGNYGSYDVPWASIGAEDDNYNYDEHWKDPAGPLPTWGEILESIRKNRDTEACSNMCFDEVERIIKQEHPDLDVRLNEDDPDPDTYENSRKMETISLFIEAFEEFLEERGIDVPNPEKDDDPHASLIYGSDYGDISDRIESLLNDLDMLN